MNDSLISIDCNCEKTSIETKLYNWQKEVVPIIFYEFSLSFVVMQKRTTPKNWNTIVLKYILG
jgi:hypothetical protein